MIREERPGVDGERTLRCQVGQAGDEVGPVRGLGEDDPAFEPAHHHVVDRVRGIQAGLAGGRLARYDRQCNVQDSLEYRGVTRGEWEFFRLHVKVG